MPNIQNLLKRHQLRNTAVRRNILELFMDTEHALTHSYIEKELNNEFDRVTLYRTLKAFEEKGLIHRIANEIDSIEYALCRDDCEEDQHRHADDHAHFRCENCQKTFCLDEVGIPNIKVPRGFDAKQYQLLVTGTCEQCKKA